MPKSKRERPSSTKGITKGWNCKKTILKTRMAKDSRFYKTGAFDEYDQACREIGQLKGNTSYPPSEAAIKRNIETLQ